MTSSPGEKSPASPNAANSASRSDAPHPFSTTRRVFLAILLLAAAATAWWLLHAALPHVNATPPSNIVLNPGYQHSQRLRVSTARAAMDALAIVNGGPDVHRYQMDYSIQRTQIQADSEGLERWSPEDPRHQGLLHSIRTSLAGLLTVLNQTPGVAGTGMHMPATAGAPKMEMHSPAGATGNSSGLLPALDQVQQALSNYSASLTESAHLPPSQSLLAGPLLLWWILVLLLVELGVMAWLIFPPSRPSKR